MAINKTLAFLFLQLRIEGKLVGAEIFNTKVLQDRMGLALEPQNIMTFLFDSCGFNQTEAIVASADIPTSYLRMLYGELYGGKRLDPSINVLDFNTGTLNKEWLVNMEHSFKKEKV